MIKVYYAKMTKYHWMKQQSGAKESRVEYSRKDQGRIGQINSFLTMLLPPSDFASPIMGRPNPRLGSRACSTLHVSSIQSSGIERERERDTERGREREIQSEEEKKRGTEVKTEIYLSASGHRRVVQWWTTSKIVCDALPQSSIIPLSCRASFRLLSWERGPPPPTRDSDPFAFAYGLWVREVRKRRERNREKERERKIEREKDKNKVPERHN